MSLATTRVPDFGDEMESPHTGYQTLSTNASSPTVQYGGIVFDPNEEIMSMAPIASHNPAKLADFTRMWQTLLQPAHHFFLIFQFDSLSLFNPMGLAFASPSDDLASEGHYRSLSSSATNPNPPSPNTEIPENTTFSILPVTITSGSFGGPGSLFERQLQAAIGPSLTLQHIKDAISLKDKPLFQNYKNWLAMACLLSSEVNGLPGLEGEATTIDISANDAAEILRHFNWAPTSYHKKRRLFIWACSAAHMSWNGPTETVLHRTWKGIIYLWGKGGAFERNEKPELQSINSDERLAFRLTQDAIEKKKSDISRHITEV